MNKHIIYGLVDPNTKELRYIGYTSDAATRYLHHHAPCNLQELTYKNNWLKTLIAAGNKAEMIVLAEYATSEELPIAEAQWYDFFIWLGANLTNDKNYIGVGVKLGAKRGPHSEETKRKISESQKGKIISNETRLNISRNLPDMSGENHPMFGKHHSDESKLKISESHTGKILTEEHKRKIGEGNKGKVVSEETKRKISEKQKGKIISEETRIKQSNAHKNKEPWNKGKRGLQVAWNKGISPTEETKKKISESRKKK